jgi:hypothetical protein
MPTERDFEGHEIKLYAMNIKMTLAGTERQMSAG